MKILGTHMNVKIKVALSRDEVRISHWVSRNSCTRWFPGSCGPHPEMLLVDSLQVEEGTPEGIIVQL